ncbi:hypothetical protein DVH24_035946 [Malus domestica]|uniref:Uncharacterized protein n=1 Tax=Malus domestica TaxID=3750 RepID=A0A498JNF1_MALDO|nr:hypothetical protein DVH24_035946 [Malus domestica]
MASDWLNKQTTEISSPLKLKLIAKLSNAYFRLFDSNMLINNITMVIFLDDYHSLDKIGRKKK